MTPESPRHLVIGTAGHVDHGKSALVQALTGTDPDRLKEEKRRGITIELGFADLDLGADRALSFVDVPGHERFVRQMVAGAMGVDAVLLVVAADQGIQPQTREHLAICSLLGVRRGIVVLSKSDLVDAELQDVVALELREWLDGTFLGEAPLVSVSIRDGTGLEALRQALVRLLDETPRRSAQGVARLPVDRSFVLKGLGAVVTGTLVSGAFEEGQEVAVLPGNRRGRIRGLQVHHHQVRSSSAGSRTAINLQGLDAEDVPRGATLTSEGGLLATRRVWVRLTLLPSAPKSLEKGGPAQFHQGTDEQRGRVRVIAAWDDGFLAEIRLAGEMVLAPGDRFILRRPAPVDTVGGGIVLDICPPRRAEASRALQERDVLRPDIGLELRLERAGTAGREPLGLRAELGLSGPELDAAFEVLRSSGAATAAGSRWFWGPAWRQAERDTVLNLAAFHREQPLRPTMSREVLRRRVGSAIPQEAWRELLERAVARGELRLAGEGVAGVGHEVVIEGAELELARRIEQAYRGAGLDPPDLDQLIGPQEQQHAGPIVDLLVGQGKLVRIQDRRLFHADALDELRSRLRDYALRSRTIDVAAFKELAGVTRKNAIPLLEQLDHERVTRRVGNLREILV